ncbi:phosphonoacetaldehyde reductase [Spirochaeta dissipatitropha]
MIVLESLADIISLIQERNFSRIMVFHGSSSFTGSGGAGLAETLGQICEITYAGPIPENPEYSRIQEYVDAYNLFEPEVILSIGGGSVIDTAKAVLAAASQSDIQELFSNNFSLSASSVQHIAVPTTSGSGAEATHFAVVYKDGVKHSLANPDLIPDVVVLDPATTLSCPLKVTLSSGADAICQSIESFWSRSANEESRELSLQALRYSLEAILSAANDPADIMARGKMQKGSHLAGRAINITKTTAGHALSYGLTIEYGLPHGIAVLLVMEQLLPIMIHEYGWSSTALDSVFQNSRYKTGLESGFSTLAAEIKNLYGVISIENGNKLNHLVDSVNIERLKNHPVDLRKIFIESIYKSIISQ